MSELTTDAPIPFPSPSIRREHGIFDARHGRPMCGSDKHYVIGYRLGERLRPDATPQDPANASQDVSPGT